ncbi:DNA topoisomerase 1 beta [Actinidia rufa]|uniref:DNA topoisomerase 1 beta n=1 Tax=Actinidia rufa TaxID=165716 RepID=A0A7J0ED14_9ERIC|nr:DNA topoisomerase 1 beta [Actinidia rufa]
MEGEIKNLIKVWLSITASLCYCYFISSRIPKGKYRLLSLLPIFSLFTHLPLQLTFAFPTAVVATFITWIATFKLLLFAFDRGPLSPNPPKSLALFITIACLPIRSKQIQNNPSPESPKSTKPKKLHLNLGSEIVIFAFLIGVLNEYREIMHDKIVLVVYCVLVFLLVEVLFSFSNGVVQALVGLELEPPSDEPYLSTSLQDFWGKRWNLTACATPKMMDEIDDDDDMPLVFKRSNASKQNQLNLESKKSSSQRHVDQSRHQVSEVPSSNGPNSTSQKGKPVLSTKASPSKSPASSPKAWTSSTKASAIQSPSVSPKALTSSAKASPVKSLETSSKVSTSAADQSKHSYQQNTSSTIKKEKQLINSLDGQCSDSEDSGDNKPLSARFSAGLPKGNPNQANKGANISSLGSPPLQKSRVKDEDLDDEVPLSSKFQLKSNAGLSSSKSGDTDEKKPMALKLQKNGSTMNGKQHNKSSTVLNKRPLGDVKSSSQSSFKRPKLVEGSSPVVDKKVSVKAESKVDDDDDDDDDDIPISQRLKKANLSGNKSSSVKQKVTKVIKASFKKTSKKAKKVVKNSKYSKSSKAPPSSGEGQKWTTLVHSGIIFPPTYKPHGVKMLYKGKPVDLTPEQEEEKKALKEEKLKQEEKYMWAIVDGVKEKKRYDRFAYNNSRVDGGLTWPSLKMASAGGERSVQA